MHLRVVWVILALTRCADGCSAGDRCCLWRYNFVVEFHELESSSCTYSNSHRSGRFSFRNAVSTGKMAEIVRDVILFTRQVFCVEWPVASVGHFVSPAEESACFC